MDIWPSLLAPHPCLAILQEFIRSYLTSLLNGKDWLLFLGRLSVALIVNDKKGGQYFSVGVEEFHPVVGVRVDTLLWFF